MDRVGVEFTGGNTGAVTAARGTATAIREVRAASNQASPSLHGLETDIGRVERGALAGTGALHGMGRAALYLGGTYFGAFGLGDAFKAASAELGTQVKGNALVQAALRSTGGIAGETARSIDQLAKSESRKTAIDSDQIKSAETMLLRFTNVRNVVGEGNDIFKRATQTALDMSVALGRDASDSAFTLGKALQDPVKGLTLLRREGITFTVAEENQIKTLAEHGQVLTAQKKILDSLALSYGGTAAKVGATEPYQRLKNTLTTLSADALRPLLPDFDKLAARADKWTTGLENNSQKQKKLKTDVESTIAVAKQFVDAADKVIGAVGGWRQALELVLGLKLIAIIGEWTGALATFIGTEAGATGLAGASAEAGALNGRLKILRALTSKPFQFVVAYEIIKKITHSNADLSNNAGGPGDLLPIYTNGKWVDPITGDPVADQAYWNNKFKKDNPGQKKPTSGQTAGGSANPKINQIVSTAESLGPASGGIYVYGGTGSKVVGSAAGGQVSFVPGYDCSGYVQDVYKRNGIDIPRTSQAQFADPKAEKVALADLEPGDAVYFNNGETGHAQPDHVGIVVTGHGQSAVMIDYFTSGKKAETIKVVDKGLPFMGGRRWVKTSSGTGGGSKPGTTTPPPSSTPHPSSPKSTDPVPGSVRLAVSVADAAAAAAALTPGKADDKAAIAKQRAALDEEIAWLRGKLKTNLGTEKRITLEDLLTGALGNLASLTTAKKAGGAGIATVTSLRNTVTQDLKSLPATLDDVEQNAVSHLEKLRKALTVGLSAKDLATTRIGIQNWGKVLKNEISKQAKAAQDAAQAAASLWARGWQNDVNKVLRDFQENVVDKQLADFDKATQQGLAAIQAKYSAQTPEEKALADFKAKRDADQEASQRSDIQSQIADVESQLAGLGQTATDTASQVSDGINGTLIDIATGTRTALTQAAAAAGGSSTTDVVTQRADLLKQLADLNDQARQLDLDDQEAALQASADASRTAQDQKEQDDQTAYQSDRDAQRTALSDRLSDQATALSQDLDDWNTWIGKKQKSWSDFLTWLQQHGISTAGIGDPANTTAGGALDSLLNPPATSSTVGDRLPFVRTGAIAFAAGGKVPGSYVGHNDTLLARLTPGETVIDRQLTAALERMLVDGGGGGPTVAVFKIGQRQVAQAIAQPMTDAQARQIGYTMPRG